MRTLIFGLSLIALQLVLLPGAAIADGGRVELSRRSGQYQVTVFSSPASLQPGPVDFSFLIQDTKTGEVLSDIAIEVICQHSASGRTLRHSATQASATNQLLSSAKFDLPVAGQWQLAFEIGAPVSTTLELTLATSAASFSVSTITLIALSPLAFAAVYLLRERIKNRS